MMDRAAALDPAAADVHRPGSPWAWLALGAVLLVYGLICRPQLSVPLNRDEGEFAYGGQLLRSGGVPYVDLYAMKLPGMYLAMAAIQAVGGESVTALHTAAALVNAATAGVLFLIVRRLLGPLEGVAAAAALLLWLLNPRGEPLAAQAELFVILPASVGWWSLLCALDEAASPRRTLILLTVSGLGFGLGVLMKQHGLMLMAGAAGYAVWRQWRQPPIACPQRPLGWRRWLGCGAIWTLAAALPWLLTVAAYGYLGHFDTFWYWTVTTSRYYGAAEPLAQGFANLANEVQNQFAGAPWLWCLVGVGATTVWWSQGVRQHAALVAALTAASFLAISPKLLFRNHYFFLAGPAVAVLAACALRGLAEAYAAAVGSPATRRWAAAAVGVVVLGWTAAQDAAVYYSYSPEQLSRALYGLSAFPESEEIAAFLRANTEPDEPIAVLGSEPQLFYLSGRRSASPHIYTYPLMEPNEHAPQLQEEMIDNIVKARPKYLIWVNSPQSWLPRPGSHQRILEWFGAYRETHCELIEVYDLITGEEVVRRRGEKAAGYQPRGPVWLGIYRRTDDP